MKLEPVAGVRRGGGLLVERRVSGPESDSESESESEEEEDEVEDEVEVEVEDSAASVASKAVSFAVLVVSEAMSVVWSLAAEAVFLKGEVGVGEGEVMVLMVSISRVVELVVEGLGGWGVVVKVAFVGSFSLRSGLCWKGFASASSFVMVLAGSGGVGAAVLSNEVSGSSSSSSILLSPIS